MNWKTPFKELAKLRKRVFVWEKNPGKVRFSDGTEYKLGPNGNAIRLSPRPYRGKSDRRRVILERRMERFRSAARNLQAA